MLGITFLVQIADTHSGYKNLKPNFMNQAKSEWETPLKNKFWSVAAPMYKKLVHITPVNHMDGWKVLSDYASRNGLATDAVYLARIDDAKLKRAQKLSGEIIKSGKYAGDSIYIIDDHLLSEALQHINTEVDTIAKIDGFNVLAPGWRKCLQCPKVIDELYLENGSVTIRKAM